MKLFTKDIDQKLFEQYPKGSDLNNQMVVAKIFNPYGRGTWYLLNSDPEDPDYIWAITDLFEIEVGSVSRTDLESIKFKPFMLGLERDMYFTPVNAMELYKGLQSGKQYAKGGGVKYYNKENEYRLSRPSSNIEKEILDRVTFKESMTNDMFVGSFGWKTPQGKIAEGYLYKLDDFDKNLIKNVSLKSDEKVFRYVNRATAIGGMMPFIKINLEKSLLYFLIHNQNDDIIFETRGVNAMFINIIEDKMAHGGGVDVKIPTQGTMISKDKKNKIDYKKVGNNYELIVYEGEPNAVENYSRTSFKKKTNGVVTMNHNQFINYIYTEGYVDDKMAEGGGIKPFKIEKNNTTIYINGTENDIRKMYLDYLNNFLTLGAFAEHYGISDEQALMIIEKGKKYAKDSGKYADGGNTETSILLSTKSVQELVDKFNNAVFKGVGGIHEGKKYYEVQASKFAADGIKRELPSGYVLKNVGGDLYWIIQPSFVGKKASEIKRMAEGGGVESKIRGGIKYVQGQDLEWHDIMSFDIATYGEKEAEKKAYDYIQDSIKYWNGELNEDDFNVKRSRNGKDYKGSWVVMRQFPKFAKGGNIESENAEMVKSYNKQIAHHTKEMTEAINKNGEVPAWVVAKMTRSASDLSDATHYMEGKGEEYAKGGGVGDVKIYKLNTQKGVYYEIVGNGEKSLGSDKNGRIFHIQNKKSDYSNWKNINFNQLPKTLQKSYLEDYNHIVKNAEKYATGGGVGELEIGNEVEIELNNGKIVKGKVEKINPLKIRTDATSTQVIPNALIKKVKQYAKGGGTGKAYTIYIYYGGEQANEVVYADSLEEAKILSQRGEHSEIIDNGTNEILEFGKGGGVGVKNGEKFKVILDTNYGIKTEPYEAIVEVVDDDINSRGQVTVLHISGKMKGTKTDMQVSSLTDKYAKGGGIGFIPMDLEEELAILAKWGGLNIRQVIEYLNAMIDAGLTDNDLEAKPTKNTLFQREKAVETKINEIWKKIKPYYKGNLQGYRYYSLIKELVSRTQTYNILSKFKPYRKYQEFAKGGATPAQKRKIGKVMHEWKQGDLHIGKSDKVVKNPKQAIAIALSEAGLSKKENGGGMGWNAKMKNWKKK
jgi:hypothetical protein